MNTGCVRYVVVRANGAESAATDPAAGSAFAPRHLFGLWTTRRFDNGFGLSLGLRTLSDQFIAEDNRFRIDGYATLDAGISYDAKPARFSMTFKNLTGTEHETRGFGAVSAIPARPFELVCRVEFSVGER